MSWTLQQLLPNHGTMTNRKAFALAKRATLAATLMAAGIAATGAASWPASATAQQGNYLRGEAAWVVETDSSDPYTVEFGVADGVFNSTITGVRPSPRSLPLEVVNGDGDKLLIYYDSERRAYGLEATFGARGVPPLACGGNVCVYDIEYGMCTQSANPNLTCHPHPTEGCATGGCGGTPVTPCPDNQDELCTIVNAGKTDWD